MKPFDAKRSHGSIGSKDYQSRNDYTGDNELSKENVKCAKDVTACLTVMLALLAN